MLLSVIVPLLGSPGYARAALDSVLADPATELEALAVVTSEQGSAALAAEYARRDPRVRTVAVPETAGPETAAPETAAPDAPGALGPHPGPALNAGADAARGGHLLFLDADDVLLPGAVPAVLRALRALRADGPGPDVLHLGHERVDWWGAAVATPEPAAGDQVVRRAFWTAHGLRFADGPYGEVAPVHRAALLAADAGASAALERVCVRHRVRRTGTFASTPGRGHFAVIEAYARLLAETGDDPRVHPPRTAHLLAVLEDPGRIRPADRADFFRAAALEGTYAAHRARRTRDAVAARVRQAAGRGRRVVRRQVMRAAYRTDLHRGLDPRLAVYGAYWNRGVACNPAAIHAKARELLPHIEGVWAVSSRHRDRVPPGVPYVIEGSRAYWRAMATAGYLVNNSSFPGGFTKRPGQRYLQTHHGTPLKTMGLDQRAYPALTNGVSFEKILAHADQWDFSLSANPHSTEIWDRVYPAGYTHLELGYPRNDVYFTATADQVAKIRADLGIAEGQTALLYAPTHRDYRKGFAPDLDAERLARELGPGHVLLVRAHYFYGRSTGGTGGSGRVLDVTAHPRVEELCLAADALITDYSSLMFDYACLDRPILVHAPDWAAYRAARGTYFDLLSGRPGETPGAVATTQEELTELLRTGRWRSPETAALRTAFRERFCPYDDGHAAERVVRRFFGDAG
ncbi:CDP-glycerol:poly(glycerophosphate) glycerophosphotransferase [Streptomyces sp. ADI96-02]|nr:CDP-glycerol:poly(glycerophosphate) glycerophosphotransferase [Streptomyces sp. ADI96-02]